MAKLIRREFRPEAAWADLPFVADIEVAPGRTRRSFWHVPPAKDYAAACDMGRQYACDLVQHLKDDPADVGSNVLGAMAADMAAQRLASPNHGYEVGFWSTLEYLLYGAATGLDHWDFTQQIQDSYDVIARARAIEEQEEPNV